MKTFPLEIHSSLKIERISRFCCHRDWQAELGRTTVDSVSIDKKTSFFHQFQLRPLFVSARIARVLIDKRILSIKTEMTVICHHDQQPLHSNFGSNEPS